MLDISFVLFASLLMATGSIDLVDVEYNHVAKREVADVPTGHWSETIEHTETCAERIPIRNGLLALLLGVGLFEAAPTN